MAAAPLILLSGYCPVVTACALDVATGALTVVATSEGGDNPSYMAISPDGTRAYAVNETPAGRVSAFEFDAATGALKRINDVPSEGDDPCHVAVHPSGRFVLVANYSSGTLTALAVRPEDGGLAPLWSVSPGKNAHEARFSACGGRLYVPCLGSDAVLQYAFDAATGAIAPLAGAPASAPLATGAGPRHMAFSPDGAIAYVLNELDSTLTSFAVCAATGALEAPQTLSTLPPGAAAAGNSTAHVVVSPDGRLVIASNRGHNSLAVFTTAGASDGARLAPAAWETGGGDVCVPRDFALSPCGQLLVVANKATDSVTTFRVDASTGALAKLATTVLPAGRAPTFVGWVAR